MNKQVTVTDCHLEGMLAQWPLTERRTGSQSAVRMADHPWSPAGSAATADTGTLRVNSDITKQGATSGAAIASTKGSKPRALSWHLSLPVTHWHSR